MSDDEDGKKLVITGSSRARPLGSSGANAQAPTPLAPHADVSRTNDPLADGAPVAQPPAYTPLELPAYKIPEVKNPPPPPRRPRRIARALAVAVIPALVSIAAVFAFARGCRPDDATKPTAISPVAVTPPPPMTAPADAGTAVAVVEPAPTPADADDRPASRRREKRDARKPPPAKPARAEAPPPSTQRGPIDMRLVVRDESGAKLPGLASGLDAALARAASKSGVLKRTTAKPARGVDVTAAIAKTSVTTQRSTTTVEIGCTLTVSDLPTGGLRFASRSSAAATLEGTPTATSKSELAADALDACARAIAQDLVAYAKKSAAKR